MQILSCCKVLSKSKNVKLIVGFVMLVMFILLNIFHFCDLLNIILSFWSTCTHQPRIYCKKFKITNFKSTHLLWVLTVCTVYLHFSTDDMFDLGPRFDCRIGMIHQGWRGRQLTSRQVLSAPAMQIRLRLGQAGREGRRRVGPCFSGQHLVWSSPHHRDSPLLYMSILYNNNGYNQ